MPAITPSTGPAPTPATILPPATSPASTAAATKAAAPTATPAPAAPSTPADAPGTTVTLSPQALSLSQANAPGPAAPSSTYDALKNGISTGVSDVGEAISDSAHWVADGVGSGLAAAHTLAQGIVALPFAAVAKTCDAAGALIDAV
jgi:hypothetical protein